MRVLHLPFTLFLFVCFVYSGNAQVGCGTDALRTQLKQDPSYVKKEKQYREATRVQAAAIEQNSKNLRVVAGVSYIPVVVHIIAPLTETASTFVTDQQVLDGISHLNHAFKNSDEYQVAGGVDTKIQFCLAKQDKMGNYTTGITRLNHERSDLPFSSWLSQPEKDIKDAVIAANSIGGVYKYDPHFYLNIYLVRDISGEVAAYAWPPTQHGNTYEDGIVSEARYFGVSSEATKVVVHEAGHYLGLLHTFEGNCPSGNCPSDAFNTCPVNNQCDVDGDNICDTPPDKSTANYGCNSGINTCDTDDDDTDPRNPFRSGALGDQPDLISNHMDYGDLACHNSFTQGQSNWMNATLTLTRLSLMSDQYATGCSSPCPNPLKVRFTVSSNPVSLPTSINFANTTLGNQSGYSWLWDFGDGTTSTLQTPASKQYVKDGTYFVKLTAINSDASCKRDTLIAVTANCPLQPAFTVNGEVQSLVTIAAGGSITLTNTSTSVGITIEWLKDGVVIGTGPTITPPFPTTGGYMISQRISNASCSKTSANVFVDVNTCGGSAGKERYNWIFGNPTYYNSSGQGGEFLKFDNSGNTNLSVTTTPFNGFEGVTTVSNSKGELLLYANIFNIFDREGNILANFPSGTPTQIIAFQDPNPAKANLIYFFFPETTMDNIRPGFWYAIIDMNAGRTGINGKSLGALSISLPPDILYAGLGQSVTAVKSIDGKKIFVVTYDWENKEVIVYTIDDQNGLDKIGKRYSVSVNPLSNSPSNIAKISPDGTKLAFRSGNNEIVVYNFDPETGDVKSNLFNYYNPNYGFTYPEFSPDGSKLYVPVTISGIEGIAQFDLNNNNSIYIIKSPHTPNSYGIQLGPDGKLYLTSAGYNNLHVINSPNAPGDLCDIQWNRYVTNIAGPASLPNFLIDLSQNSKLAKLDAPSCVSINASNIQVSCILPSNRSLTAGETLKWTVSHTDPMLAEIVSTNGNNAILKFYGAGLVKLKMELFSPCGYQVDEKVIQIGNADSLNLGPDQSNCNGSDVILDAGAGYKNYLWKNAAGQTLPATQVLTTNLTGTYSVKVTDYCGGEATDYITISNGTAKATLTTYHDEPAVLVPTCHPTVTLVSNGLETYTWKKNNVVISGSTGSTLLVNTGGTYTVEGVDNRGCFASASITVIDGLTITGDDQICPNEKASLNVNIAGVVGNYYVQWIQNGGAPTYTPSGGGGDYYAIVVLPTFAGCSLTTAPKHVTLKPAPSPYTVSTDKQFICGNAATLTAKAPAYTAVPITNNIWSNGAGEYTGMPATNVVSNVTAGGSYFVTSMGDNKCSVISNVIFIVPHEVRITQRCTSGGVGMELIADQNIPDGNYVWKNSGGTVVATTRSYIPTIVGTYTVTSTSTNCQATASTVVCTQPSANLGTNLVTRGDFNITGVASPICTNYAVSSDLTCSDATTTPLNSGTWPSNFKITSNAGPENLNKWSGTGFADPGKPNDTYCMIADGRVTLSDERVWYQQVSVENCATYTFRALIDNIIINEAEIPRVSLRIKNGSVNSFIKGTTVFASQSNWVELSGTWKSTMTGTVEVSVVLDGGGFVGRDIAVDEIYFAKTNCSSLDEFRPGRSCKAVTDVGMSKYICSGKSVQIGNNAGTVPGLTYLWTAPGYSSTTINPTVNPTVTNTYKLVVTDNVNNCSATDYVTVNIITPEVTITKDLTAGCTATQVKASLFNGVPNVQYEWQIDGVVSVTNTTGIFSLAGIAIGKVIRCRLVTACSSTIYSNSITVGPSAPITATQTTICSGTSTQLHANMSGGTAPYTYTWTASTGAVPDAIAEPIVSPTAPTTYSLTFKDANNCTFTGSVFVMVNALPSLSISASQNPACEGSKIGVTFSYTSGSSLAYTLPSTLVPYNASGSQTGITYQVDVVSSGTGNIVGTATSSQGCSTTLIIPFTAHSLPTAQAVSITPNPACNGATISVSVIHGAGNTGSLTKPPMIGTTTGSSNQYGFGYTAPVKDSGSGNFVSTTVSAQGCSTIVNIPFTALPKPAAPAITSTGTLICSGSPILLSTTSTGTAYQWYNGASPIVGATNTSYSTIAVGTYMLRISDVNTCWNTSPGIALTTSTLAAPRVHVDDATDGYCVSTPVAMKVGTALQLNGTNQYVNVPGFNYPASGSGQPNGGPITVEFWINSNGSYNAVFSLGGFNSSNRALAHVPAGDGNLYWDYGNFQGNGRISTPFTAYVNKWTHVALVSAGNGGSFKAIYLNGVLVASSTTASSGPSVQLNGLTIGQWLTYYTGGMIDEFRIWNKVLSSTEVQAAMTTLYESGTPNLMGSWGFDEASGTTVQNDAFSLQPGTIMNSATRVYPTTGLTYTWTPSAYLNTSTGTTVIPNTSITRTYTVKGVDVTSGCSAYAQVVATPNPACKDVADVSSAELNTTTEWDVEIYPNPTEGDLHISVVNVNTDTNLSLEVVGMDGAIIFNIDRVGAKEVVNLRELPGGLYLIRVKNGEEVKTKKIVVVK